MHTRLVRTAPIHALAVLALSLALNSSAQADQPKMRDALASLEQAQASLQAATEDKGGHRAKALRAVEAAIHQVKAGIEFDRTHANPVERQK